MESWSAVLPPSGPPVWEERKREREGDEESRCIGTVVSEPLLAETETTVRGKNKEPLQAKIENRCKQNQI